MLTYRELLFVEVVRYSKAPAPRESLRGAAGYRGANVVDLA
jgi:hypothetical protein